MAKAAAVVVARSEAAAPEGVGELFLVRLVRFVDVGHARRLGARTLRLRRRPLRRLLGLGQPRAQLLGLRLGALRARGGGDVARPRLGGGHLDDAGGVGALQSGLRLGEGGVPGSRWQSRWRSLQTSAAAAAAAATNAAAAGSRKKDTSARIPLGAAEAPPARPSAGPTSRSSSSSACRSKSFCDVSSSLFAHASHQGG